MAKGRKVRASRRSEERFSRNAETDLVCRLLLEKKNVAGARLYSFPADSEVNWSRRQPGAAVQAASSAGGLEVTVSTYDLDRFDATRFRALVYADDFLGA